MAGPISTGVTQEMINKFADATGDHQFIHVDEEKREADARSAARSPTAS
jgi:acyl dehydratase